MSDKINVNHPTAVNTFHSKPKNVILIVALEENSGDLSDDPANQCHYQGTMNTCTKCHGNSYNKALRNRF